MRATESGDPLTFEGFGGVALAAESWGHADRPAVLLLPGGGQSKSAYRRAARALADAGRRVICVDLRGHGESGWPSDGRYDLDALSQDVVHVLRQMGSRPVVIGASLGGLAALAALGESEVEVASGLVLVDAAPQIDQEEAGRIKQLMHEYASGFETAEEALEVAHRISPHRPKPKSADRLREHLRTDDSGRLRWLWDERFLSAINADTMAVRLEQAARGLKIPVLLLRGESGLVTSEATERLQSLLNDAESIEIAGAGHLVASDRADAFNATVLEFLERRAPRSPERFTEGSDARTLRNALGCFGTGVTVVTTVGEDGPVGVTANSFTAVSLDPPLILFCLSGKSSSLPAFRSAGRFAINVLHIGQQPASNAFAGPQESRFASVKWEMGKLDVPVIVGSLATFECETESVHEAGDHVVMIGRVKSAIFEPRRDPLLFFRGRYRRLHFS
ncbi:MAG: alpha/beta fold hydrolase [Phenylobacterium sp.]|nr:alpha/beta fold hydrolase [Phenylobacterium sp.]MDP3749998.1 alpha/beta fold hydrolase [Phenylobacterium sp.]